MSSNDEFENEYIELSGVKKRKENIKNEEQEKKNKIENKKLKKELKKQNKEKKEFSLFKKKDKEEKEDSKKDLNVLEFEVSEEQKTKRKNKKKSFKEIFSNIENISKPRLALIIALIVIIVSFIFIFVCYKTIEDFRDFIDFSILKKEITIDNVKVIDLESNQSYSRSVNSIISKYNVFVYDDKICSLKENKLRIFNKNGNVEKEILVEISDPLVCSNGQLLLVAENNGNKLYNISGKDILWEKDIDKRISKISINENGYVALVGVGSTYKSVIYLFDPTGEEVFRKYISNSVVIDLEISSDNKNLAYAEIDTTGSLINSTIKVVSIEKAKAEAADAVTYEYTEITDKLLNNISYYGDSIVAEYDGEIKVIKAKKEVDKVIDFNTENVIFADVSLKDRAIIVKENQKEDGSAQTRVEFINPITKSSRVYNLKGAAKEIYTYKDKAVINIGSELFILRNNGTLVKKYVSEEDISEVHMTNNIVVVVNRNKLEVIEI